MSNNSNQNTKTPLLMASMLLNGSYTKDEITSILNIKDATFFKNIQLMKDAGFRFEKENRKYKIATFINTLNLTSKNISTLSHILTLSYNLFPKHKTKSLLVLFKKILYLSKEENFEMFLNRYYFFKKSVSSSEYCEKIEQFQKHLNKKTALKVTLKNNEKYNLKALDFAWVQDRVIFVFEDLDTKERREILPENIVKMYNRKEIFQTSKDRETIFELTGRMVRTYLLKEEEILLETHKDRIVVANYSTDKQKLFARLLKYDVLCKIKFPKQDRTAFMELLKKSLENISEIQDNSIK